MNSTKMEALDSAFATAAELVAAIRAKEISARELLDATFQRIDRYNPKLNAIIWPLRDQAIARAKQADEATVRGTASGPLHGVPITIKESFAYRGSPNTWGLPPLEKVLSPRTAVAVERLEASGAITVGKTNVPVMLGDWQSYNPIYGTTNNPWDLARTPGGSTGGGAAALAAGLGALTLGSDLSGSIRIPAHFCGVYGHKPSLELVPTAGFLPGPWDGSPGLLMDVSVVGPLARSARDLALALDVLGGPQPDEAKAWSWRMPAPRHKRLKDFRVGYLFDDSAAPVSAEVREVYERLLKALARSGAKLEQGWPRELDVEEQLKTFGYLVASLVTSQADDEERAQARKRHVKNPHDIFAAAMVEPHARWLSETQRRLAFRALWQNYFATHDVFLMPVTTTAAFPHDHRAPMEARTIETSAGQRPYIVDMSYWITSASLTGLPATIAPVGKTSASLPVGVQILGPMWEDATPIEFAAQLADEIGGFTPPPDFAETIS